MHPSRQIRGFTLIELLVVIFIIGIIAAMATLSVGTATREKGLEKEIERIGDLVRLASDEAVLQNRELGLTFYRTGYEFSTYDAAEQVWVALGDASGPFAPRKFPPETEVEVELEGRRIAIDERPPERKAPDGKRRKRTDVEVGVREEDENRPQVMILSSGDVMPFGLRLRTGSGGDGVALRITASGDTERRDDAR